jgi:hypothetical protein
VETAESLQRFFHEVDDTVERIWGEEAFAAGRLGLWWSENSVVVSTPAMGRPKRRVEKTQLYDSEEVEKAERQKREAFRQDKPSKK